MKSNYCLTLLLSFLFVFSGHAQTATNNFAKSSAVFHQKGTSIAFINNKIIEDNTPIATHDFKNYLNYKKNESEYNNLLYTYQTNDSIVKKAKWYKTDTGKSLIIAGTLIGIGTIIQVDNGSFKYDVRDEINRYLPDFHDPIDDYLQYIPYAAVFALDWAGVESKHKSLRKVTTIGTAIAFNLIVIQGLKYSIAEPRPDGSSNNAFPSGHTATAFMGAHIFHKEYGHKSPFYSIAGYLLASITGVFRQLNNRHWVSDVFAGAGIGIGVTELAYFLNNKWWDEKGINQYTPTERIINEGKPSFLGLKAGYASLINETDDNEPGFSSKSGFKVSVEGAYFFNRYIGVGGEIGFQSFPISVDANIEQEYNQMGYDVVAQSAGNRMYLAGGYFQYPFGKNSIGTRLLLGAISGPDSNVYVTERETPEGEQPNEMNIAEYNTSTSFSWATGFHYRRILNDNLALRLFFDYNVGNSDYSVKYLEYIDEAGTPVYSPTYDKSSNYDSYSIGLSVDIMLW